MAIRVYTESGPKRVFACSFDWPGWCRVARDEGQALESLGAYAPRYAPVAAEAGYPLPPEIAFEVVERVPGSATTDFGAPAAIPEHDRVVLQSQEADRTASLVAAAWIALDRVVAAAPAELRKGPRGGGRDRDKVVAHVLAAETAYARKLGVRQHEPAIADRAAIMSLRDAILAALHVSDPPAAWPAPYAARRIAWHVLDHAWEIEDRSTPA